MRKIAAAALLAAGTACAADLTPMKDAGPYVPSPQSVVSDMLREAGVTDKDFLIDLGSGDGRIVRTAAKIFGARGFGVEIKEDLVRQANEAAANEGIGDRVKFVKADLFKTDISQATVITMYLLPDTVNMLKDKFLGELRPGTRIVSHQFDMAEWKPAKTVELNGRTIYFWTIPERKK
jgi:ribosomal protein L11 methylase PrmA